MTVKSEEAKENIEKEITLREQKTNFERQGERKNKM